ncbi:pyroglutamylated RF-amide peptide receptor isoform X1 [Hydra vulgaris]|uniref:pyroglutamylated RF-amide peptide receptor isoform X1 n=1 Tax=Hydra vulgaris TaxID=6087 RepID=UPI001F5EBF6F|nr:pyroglutamylated RF-amide peptide receptor-like [Hydra vulgaris]
MSFFIVTFFIATICTNDVHSMTNKLYDSSEYYFNTSELHKTILNEENSTQQTNTSNMTLKELCKLFEIPEKNCTCDEENSEMKELCSFHKSDKTTKFSCDYLLRRVVGFSNIISSTLALIGNTFVILISFVHRKEFSRFNQLVLDLAISDFVFAAVQLIISIPETLTCHWVYGLFLCKTLRTALAASANIAVGFIVLIAVERYTNAVHSFKSIVKSSTCKMIKYLNIILGILSVIPPLIVLQLGKFNTCSEEWSNKNSIVYTWILFLFYYLFPIILLVVLYTSTVLWLKKYFCKSSVLNDAEKILRLEKNKKILSMLVAIVIIFAILVLPNRLVWIINDMYGLENFKNKNTIRLLRMISEICYGFHAAVNPIIYLLFDAKFRQRLKALLTSNGCRLLSQKTTVKQSNQQTITSQF